VHDSTYTKYTKKRNVIQTREFSLLRPRKQGKSQGNLSLFPNAGGEMMYDIQACQPTHSDQNFDTVTS